MSQNGQTHFKNLAAKNQVCIVESLMLNYIEIVDFG